MSEKIKKLIHGIKNQGDHKVFPCGADSLLPAKKVFQIKDREDNLLYAAEGDSFKAVLEQAIKSGISLKRADLSIRNLDGIDLSGINLEGADFERATLRNANLKNANLNLAIMTQVNFENADATGASFKKTNLGRAKFQNTKFEGADLEGAGLFASTINKVIFDNAKLEGIELSASNITETSFKGSNLKESCLTKLKFVNMNFEGADFNLSNIEDAEFINCNCNNTKFLTNKSVDGAKFEGSTFKNAEINEDNMLAFMINGADIEKSKNFATFIHNPKKIKADWKKLSNKYKTKERKDLYTKILQRSLALAISNHNRISR